MLFYFIYWLFCVFCFGVLRLAPVRFVLTGALCASAIQREIVPVARGWRVVCRVRPVMLGRRSAASHLGDAMNLAQYAYNTYTKLLFRPVAVCIVVVGSPF